jgi:hypothetical protein
VGMTTNLTKTKGDGIQAYRLHGAQKSIYNAERKTHSQIGGTEGQLPGGQHVKNWRPQILAFVDAEQDGADWSVSQIALLDVLSELRKGGGLTMVVSIRIGDVGHEQEVLSDTIKNAMHKACLSRKLEVC